MGGKWPVFDVTTDVGEANDLEKQHPEALRELVEAGAVWSKRLIEPQWHDTAAGLKSWNENQMPKYDTTFRIR